MAQSPAAFFCAADPTADGHRGATGFRGFGDFSVDFLLLTGYGGGGENLLPTCVLCHVSRCRLSTMASPWRPRSRTRRGWGDGDWRGVNSPCQRPSVATSVCMTPVSGTSTSTPARGNGAPVPV